MKISLIHQWIFAAIILVSATLPIDVAGNVVPTIYQTENISTLPTAKKVIRYQKAKQLASQNPFLCFDFHNFLSQNNIEISNQFKSTIQQNLPFPTFFHSTKIITTKNADNLHEVILS